MAKSPEPSAKPDAAPDIMDEQPTMVPEAARAKLPIAMPVDPLDFQKTISPDAAPADLLDNEPTMLHEADVPADLLDDQLTGPVDENGPVVSSSGIEIKSENDAFLPQMRNLLSAVTSGMVVGDYDIGARIGFGGMGAVYRGVRHADGEKVAVKFLIGDETENAGQRLDRFRQEAATIASLEHPSIISVSDFVEGDGLTAMVMDLVLGPYERPVNLLDYAEDFGTANGLLSESDMQQIALALLEALAHVHLGGVVHCDLKPENVLFKYVRAGEDGYWHAHVRLADFGLAKIVGEKLVLDSVTKSLDTLTTGGQMTADSKALIGTYEFMSPEQRTGRPATAASDIYSVGAMLLQLLTGTRELAMGDLPSSLRRGIDTGWDGIIEIALREEPTRRYTTATDMAIDVGAIQVGD